MRLPDRARFLSHGVKQARLVEELLDVADAQQSQQGRARRMRSSILLYKVEVYIASMKFVLASLHIVLVVFYALHTWSRLTDLFPLL